MLTLDTSPLADRSPFTVALPPKRHARDEAARQRLSDATPLAALEGGIALACLAAVLIVTNRDAMPQGLDNFLSMRVTLRNVILLAGLATVWRLAFRACGLYTAGGVRVAAWESLRARVSGCAIGSLLALIIPLVTLGGGLRPRSLAYFFVMTTASTLAVRQARRLVRRRREPRRALIIGTGGRAFALMQRLLSDEAIDYEVAGFLDSAGSRAATEQIARQRIGTLEDLERLLMQLAIDEVAIALPIKSHYHEIQKAILVCERVGVRTKYEATLFDSQVAWPRYDNPTSPTVTLHVVPNDYRLVFKRALDLIGAVAALIVLSPVMLAAAIATKATSRGPVIFTQERYGLNRRRFRIFKFRTMLVDAEELQATLEAQNEADGPVFKISDDPRITRVGRFLRRTSIDELPQLLNVIRGDMSLVGPRPLPLRDVTRFTCASDMRRFSVRPGLTCLWQISGRSSLSFAEWIRLDLKYIDCWSLALDLLILVRTVPAVLWGTGAK